MYLWQRRDHPPIVVLPGSDGYRCHQYTHEHLHIVIIIITVTVFDVEHSGKLLWTKRAQEKVDRQRGATRFYSIVVATPAADGGRDSGVLR